MHFLELSWSKGCGSTSLEDGSLSSDTTISSCSSSLKFGQMPKRPPLWEKCLASGAMPEIRNSPSDSRLLSCCLIGGELSQGPRKICGTCGSDAHQLVWWSDLSQKERNWGAGGWHAKIHEMGQTGWRETLQFFFYVRGSTMIYPLVNIYITMENYHFEWENSLYISIHGHFLQLFVCLPGRVHRLFFFKPLNIRISEGHPHGIWCYQKWINTGRMLREIIGQSWRMIGIWGWVKTLVPCCESQVIAGIYGCE